MFVKFNVFESILIDLIWLIKSLIIIHKNIFFKTKQNVKKTHYFQHLFLKDLTQR